MTLPASFGARLLEWYDAHGRRDLPWQHPPTPYRVWVSEIMLQQTQVQAVIPYFQRFMQRFADVHALAAAPVDEVLHLWSGLGYYARARNLHRAAAVVVAEHGGELPTTLQELIALPGIGRSTAAAILALSHGDHHAILDGNVKRVLCRYHAIEGWPGTGSVSRRLWAIAEAHTPDDRVAAYTQAIMDLGATVCTRSQPACGDCPVNGDCLALAEGRESELPTPRPRKAKPIRETIFVIVRDPRGRVLLERRPPAGVWGGLWSFPECDPGTEITAWCLENLGLSVHPFAELEPLRHTFSHFRLDITPTLVDVDGGPSAVGVRDDVDRQWYDQSHAERIGLAAPVTRLLEELRSLVD
ncbi:MAG: A/G-specific adenine glycosylase [Gammaproteobacteria bacterium]|nr:A/G-specific adenine glycosylase [Gammaproteobacteria bacterium]